MLQLTLLRIATLKGYGLLNILFRSTFSLQYGHICFFPTMHHPLMQNSWNLDVELRLGVAAPTINTEEMTA